MSQTILTRALQVVDEISKYPEGLRFSWIRNFLGNPSPTTVSKILKELVVADVLSKNADGSYVLGMKVYFWGKAASRRHGIMQNIRSHMRSLHHDLGASVNLFTCSEDNMFCLESFMAPQSPSMWPGGQSLELALPVIGSVFFYSPAQLRDEAFLRSQIEKHTEKMSFSEVQRMIETALNRDLQDDLGLFYPGMRRLAVPIREAGQVVMVLGLGVLEARIRKSGALEDIVSRLREAKSGIEDDVND